MTHSKTRAIALLSGGLDSSLAARLVKDQGIDVVGLYLASPFGCVADVEKSATEIGVRLIVKQKGEAYLDLVKNPRYGYGKNMNPCVDCRIFMFQLADVVRQDENAEFIVTGEVVGQRAMSQNKATIKLIERNSPLEDRILRPLSSRCFAPSLPEREGWIDRKQFPFVTGRGRNVQLALAEKLGITQYGSPGGGCLLTEAGFSAKVRDFFGNEVAETIASPELRKRQVELLKMGRHFRLSETAKAIVSRNQKENADLEDRWQAAGGTFFFPGNFEGPSAIGVGTLGELEKEAIGMIISRYGRSADLAEKQIGYKTVETTGRFVVYHPMPEERLNKLRI